MTTNEVFEKPKTLNELMEEIRLAVAAHLNKPANILQLNLELSNTPADFVPSAVHCSMWKGSLRVVDLKTKAVVAEYVSPDVGTSFGYVEYLLQDLHKRIVINIAEKAGVLPKPKKTVSRKNYRIE